MRGPPSEFRKAFPWSLFWGRSRVRELWDSWLGQQVYAIGWVWPFMFTAGALFFTPFDQLLTVNPLHWRSFGQQDPLMVWLNAHSVGIGGQWNGFSNHHFLNLALEGGLCIALAGWFAKRQRTGLFKWGVLATYGTVLVWAVHEGMWWGTYIYVWKPEGLTIFSGFGEIITFSLLVMTLPLGLYRPGRFIVWYLAFQLVWIAAGFPITESYKGDTPLYGTLWGDGWEVASWAWACVGFFVLEWDGLLGWYVGVQKILLKGQRK